LARALGDSPQVLQEQKNARVAQSKLAYYAAQTGRHDEAAAGYAKLLAVFPKEKDYLRRAGLATFAAGDFPAALAHWTTLLRGLSAGSDEWFEAKYHQIACLAATDKAEAAKVMQQFTLLYPKLGGGSWAAKFRTLAASLK
jgi:tetratricopeptide (TPR) repeat protein